MGTWGTGAFDSDDSMDWVADLEESRDGAAVRDALSAAADALNDEYLEAPECQTTLAAAEVVAAAAGRPARELPEEVGAWVREHGSSVAAEAALARRAIERVMAAQNSELRDVWSEEEGADLDDIAEWEAGVADLRRRLESLG